eukprot:6096-Eustigmatos_ZCMA.PRE.1
MDILSHSSDGKMGRLTMCPHSRSSRMETMISCCWRKWKGNSFMPENAIGSKRWNALTKEFQQEANR